MPYEVAKQSKSAATFRAAFAVTNYSGTRFDVKVDREVQLLTARRAADHLGVKLGQDLDLVAYQTINKIINAGPQPWEKSTGLLSVWILGMFNPSPATTIVVPIKSGPDSELGVKVTSDYFGSVPADRLVVKEDVVYFSGDGNYRSKIGITQTVSPRSAATMPRQGAHAGAVLREGVAEASIHNGAPGQSLWRRRRQ
jgi:hypothetical protein